MTNKERLDVFLVEEGYISTREKAKKMIMAGLVLLMDKGKTKQGQKLNVQPKFM